MAGAFADERAALRGPVGVEARCVVLLDLSSGALQTQLELSGR
jgi:hypothetical protein